MSADKLKGNAKPTPSVGEIKDMYCLPENPLTVQFEDVQKAFAVVNECIKPTPFTVSSTRKDFSRVDIVALTGLFTEIQNVRNIRNERVLQKGIHAAHWQVRFPWKWISASFTSPFFSFKERGALYALSMLSDEQKRKGVVAASLGNHSQVKVPQYFALVFPNVTAF